MPDKQVRRQDVVLDLRWLEQVRELPTTLLRQRRDACRELETEFSYARRLLQGKMDILAGELERRREGGAERSGAPSEFTEGATDDGLMKRLPSILAPEGTGGGSKRFLAEDLPANAGKYSRRAERLATEFKRVGSASLEEIAQMRDELAAEERTVSADRRTAQKIVDAVNAELVRRYKDGEEDPSALLSM